MPTPMVGTDIFRAYDEGFVARFSPVVVQVGGEPMNTAVVDGIAAPVPIGVGMPEEWYKKLSYPQIAITRGAALSAPGRAQPAFRAQQLSSSEANTFNIQRDAPVPINILYTVELVSDSMSDMNALTLFLLMNALPVMGYNTQITALGNSYSFQGTASKDMTDYTTKDGRVFRYVYWYTVEAWAFTLECVKVKQILHTDTAIEVYKQGVVLNEDTDPALADEVVHFTFDAPVSP